MPFLSRSITGGKFFTLSGMNKKAQLRTSAPVAWRFSTEAPAALAKTASPPELWTHIKGLGSPETLGLYSLLTVLQDSLSTSSS